MPYPFDMIVANYTYFTDMFYYTRLSVFPGTVIGVKFLAWFSVIQICGLILTFVLFTFELWWIWFGCSYYNCWSVRSWIVGHSLETVLRDFHEDEFVEMEWSWFVTGICARLYLTLFLDEVLLSESDFVFAAVLLYFTGI